MADRTQRQVSFYEIVKKGKDGQPNLRMAQQAWPQILATLSTAGKGDRVHPGLVDTLRAKVITWDEQDHLLLARQRTSDEWLQRYNSKKDDIEDLEETPDSPFVASSVICFLPYGNIIGVIEATRSSPRAHQIEEWINGKSWVKTPIVVEPVMASDAIVKLGKAAEVSRLELTARGPKLARLARKPGKLGSMLREAREIGDGDINVKMIITVNRGEKRSATRSGLLHEIQEISDELGTGGAAKASLIYLDGSDVAKAEEVNFLKQRVTAKKLVSALDEKGNPIRQTSAARAILEAADEAEELLRAAVGTPKPKQ